ncbi:MAG: glycoside hydrolase domain-containing protein [Edaphobacter sp.]
MRRFAPTLALALLLPAITACAQQSPKPDNQTSSAAMQSHVGFDSNDYPGDAALPALRKHFAFVGYWLTNPPGAHQNSWVGKRDALLRNGFGFLVLANGKTDAEIKRSKRAGITPAALGKKDAATAIAAAQREHFPAHAILFLDQEEGGRLDDHQSGYLLAWTEAVAHSDYLPGVYASGQPVDDAPGKTITTIQNIREMVAAQHLHRIAFWVYQDACPPANGCTMNPPPLTSSGTPDVAAWQYAQSPRRKAITAACSKTYAADGNCYAPDLPAIMLDLTVASSSDPSHGR